MMVYAVVGLLEYAETTLLGVFSTKEKVKDYIDNIEQSVIDSYDGWGMCEVEIDKIYEDGLFTMPGDRLIAGESFYYRKTNPR